MKLFKENDELYVVARSDGRQQKEIASAARNWPAALELRGLRKETNRDRLLMRWGAAKAAAGRAAGLVEIKLPLPDQKSARNLFLPGQEGQAGGGRTV